MAVPWLKIIQLVPSVVEVSRELLKRTKRSEPASSAAPGQENSALAARIAALEENERRQAELVNQMAEQIALLARAATSLHRRSIWLTAVAIAATVIAAAAIIVAWQGT